MARDNPHLIVQSNIVGTANILELARVRKVRQVIFLSSVSAYGNTPEGIDPVPEDVVLSPTGVYGASKVAGEALVNLRVAAWCRRRQPAAELGLRAQALRRRYCDPHHDPRMRR